jgi:hypothetical protein
MLKSWWSSVSAARRRRLRAFYFFAAFMVVVGVVLGQYLIVGAIVAYTVFKTFMWITYPAIGTRRKPKGAP